MWSTTTKTGKIEFRERYKDIMTGKYKTVCVTMDKDTTKTRKLASQELQRLIATRNVEVKISDITLEQLKNKYLEYQKKTVRASTLERNSRTLNKLCPIIGNDIIVDKLTAAYVKDKLLEETKNPNTLNEYIKRLKAMFNWGYTSDYTDNIKLVKKLTNFKAKTHKEKIQDKYLETYEVSKLLGAMENKECWYYITKFMILSGLRIGEVIALDMKDITDTYISVTKTYDVINELTGPPKTLTSIREVFIQPELAKCIKDYNKWRKSYCILTGIRSKHFFFDKSGEYIAYASYEKYLKEISERILGRKITSHTLRHTHASLLLADGVPIDTISRRLGHENSKVTREIYLHVTKKLVENDNKLIKKANIIS